ncbi:MAG TPA: AraC family transcriptional regulator [Puia sp.]|nr:AraC family transcriptional regulator [Puia sp.]
MKAMPHHYQDFELLIKKVQTKNARPHRHQYFELIYVLQGQGKHIINGNQFEYKKGDLFLLNTTDQHMFKTSSPSELCIIDFTGSFFAFIRSDEKRNYQSTGFFEQMEYIFHNQYRLKGHIITNENDKQLTEILIGRLLWEKEQNEYGKEDMSRNIVFLLLQLITRYIHEHSIFPVKTKRAQRVVRDIINYIHQNIYNKENIKVENIARRFYKSKDHISLYFKKQAGITLKDYILSYKFELAKTRLLYSDLPVASIASELDFTDESHLNKLFKSKLGVTANAYRKRNKNE